MRSTPNPATSSRVHPLHRRLLLALVPTLAAWLIRLLTATLRFETVCEPGADPAVPGVQGVWCFWHQCLLASACHFQGRVPACVLISRSFDGELIARTVEKLGFSVARGSSSRAGASGLRELERAVERRVPAVFPADGPRGPRYELKPGAIKLAQRTGHPVRAFHALPERAWKLRSWDEFLVPRPFTRVVMAYARPVPVGRELDAASFESARISTQDALERARRLAVAYLADHVSSAADTDAMGSR